MALLLAATICLPARALTETQQLTPGGLAAAQAMSGITFSIKTEKIGDHVRFTMTVTPGTVPLQPHQFGQLKICQDGKTLVDCLVETTRLPKGVAYSFQVAANLLPNSTFTFNNWADFGGQPATYGQLFWFSLDDFKP